jgi:hypothetical protein
LENNNKGSGKHMHNNETDVASEIMTRLMRITDTRLMSQLMDILDIHNEGDLILGLDCLFCSLSADDYTESQYRKMFIEHDFLVDKAIQYTRQRKAQTKLAIITTTAE